MCVCVRVCVCVCVCVFVCVCRRLSRGVSVLCYLAMPLPTKNKWLPKTKCWGGVTCDGLSSKRVVNTYSRFMLQKQ